MKLFSIEEKASLLDGSDVWHTKSLEGIPPLMMADGPHGLRKQVNHSDNLGLSGSIKATAFPTASLVACSWDKEIAATMARSIAKEAKANDVNIVLGPGVNIKRSPLCGRNFEYFSEDPHLAAQMGAHYVRAMENEGIGCSVKHFCCNNQERYRFTQNSVVDERALREIYLPAFEASLKEKPASIMTSYNQVNGEYSAENHQLKTILRDEWGFEGLTISDWGATHNRVQALKCNGDLEMPSSRGYQTQKIIEAAKTDLKVQNAIDQSFHRIVQTAQKYQIKEKETIDYNHHHALAQHIAASSMVLLKNDQALPLHTNDRVAFIGGFIDEPRYQGGGSSFINPYHLESIRDVINDYTTNAICAKGFDMNPLVNDQTLFQEALDIAKQVDTVVLLVGLPLACETEGIDRKTLDLPLIQRQLIQEMVCVAKKLIVCVASGSVVNLDFCDHVDGLLMTYLGGEATSRATLDLLYGIVNPSGRLAETFIDDIKSCNVQFNDANHGIYYDESIFVGYRYYTTFDQPVRFPFGYGLSYTSFEYSQMSVSTAEISDEIEVSIKVKNIGDVDGAEVIQLYIENNKSSVYKAKRELKAFDKVFLKTGEEKEIIFHLTKRDFAYFDRLMHTYHVNQGEYKIQLAKNVNEIILECPIHCSENDKAFQDHPHLSYNESVYQTQDFQCLFNHPLPPRNKPFKRPFTLSSTLKDLKKSIFGRLLVGFIVKQSAKVYDDMNDPWMKEVMKQTLEEMPFRGISVMSGDVLPLMVAEGIIDVLNYKWITGIKKIRRGMKK